MIPGWVLSASVKFGPPASSGPCHRLVACILTEFLHEITLLSVFTVLLVVLTAFAHLNDAEAIVRRERQRTVAERDAFDVFADEITTVNDTTPVPSAGPRTAVPVTHSPGGKASVQTAYRDTVMAVPHYDDEYDEPLRVNMAAEFGDEITTAVLENDHLTPLMKQALVAKARGARERRANFVTTLDTEATALEDAMTTYTAVMDTLQTMDQTPLSDKSFDELAETWHRVQDLERQCEDYLADRQHQISEKTNNHGTHRGDASVVLQEYLYQSLPVTYPILAEGMTLLETVRTARGHVFTQLSRRA